MSQHELVAEYLRTAKTPVQLVKNFDEVTAKNITYPLYGQWKYDGVYCLLVIIDGQPAMYSRTGRPFFWQGLLAVQDLFFKDMKCQLPDGVYIGEYCNDAFSLEVLCGLMNPNRKAVWEEADEVLMYDCSWIQFHDFLTVDELLGGSSEVPYHLRVENLHHKLRPATLSAYLIAHQTLMNEQEVRQYAQKIIDQGGEGAVFKNHKADWAAGHKGWRAMKIVRDIRLDLLCVGVVFGKGKREGQIAALRFKMNDHEFNADLGKGWTDERRKAITLAHNSTVGTTVFPEKGTGSTEYPPVGKIWEVYALQYSSTGKALRLPKVDRIRLDKETPDA